MGLQYFMIKTRDILRIWWQETQLQAFLVAAICDSVEWTSLVFYQKNKTLDRFEAFCEVDFFPLHVFIWKSAASVSGPPDWYVHTQVSSSDVHREI